MRARIFLVAGAVGLIAGAFLIEACGETEPAATGSTADSGVEAAAGDAAEKDSAPPPQPEEDAATCDLKADFTKEIPDAALADGASTSGLCLQCANVSCKAEVTACNQDCPCQEFASDALTCYLDNTSNPFACAGHFAGVDTNTQRLGFAILNCLNDNCKTECATESFQDAGSDADAN